MVSPKFEKSEFIMKSLEAENERLKVQLKKSKEKNLQLKRYIQEQEDQFYVKMFDFIQNINHQNSILLHPYPIKIKASDKGNAGVFEINIKDVLCVVSDTRLKQIHLRRKVADIEGRTLPKSVISVNRNKLTIEQLQKEMDSIGYHLVQIGRGILINTMYYKPILDGAELTLQDIKNPHILTFKIGKDYLKEFIQKREDLRQIVSLHKRFVSYITSIQEA
jgi:hypothetical protein